MAFLNTNTAKSLSATAKGALLASLRRVEDPGVYSPETLDCATCHVATPAVKLVVDWTPGVPSDSVPPPFKADSSLVPASELQATFGLGNETNVHAFSYLVDFNGHNAPGISQRTVNETAAIVSYLYHHVFAGNPQ